MCVWGGGGGGGVLRIHVSFKSLVSKVHVTISDDPLKRFFITTE